MENILFVINTEGHLLTTASLVFEKFNKQNGFLPYILQVSKTGTARFKNETDQALLSDKYFEIDPWVKGFKADMQEILDTRFSRVFLFLEQLGLSVYFASYFKKRGSTICLAPDGNKPYFTVDRMALGSRISRTIHTYRYLFSHGLYYFRPYFLSWNYARLQPVDEVWVSYPDKFRNTKNHKVVGFTILPDKKVVEQVIRFFKLDISKEVEQTAGIIFYTNNILHKQELYDAEIDIISKLHKKFAAAPFYIKYHPTTPEHQIKRFRDIGLICFCNSSPAELYIASLKNSVIMGFWSASLMVNNPDCKFYWLYRYLVKEKNMSTDLVNLVNPTNHINNVSSLDDITF